MKVQLPYTLNSNFDADGHGIELAITKEVSDEALVSAGDPNTFGAKRLGVFWWVVLMNFIGNLTQHPKPKLICTI